MTNTRPVQLIREIVDADAALHVVNSIAGSGGSYIERKIYYPYFRFSADCATRMLFGRRAFSANCLVDGRNGLGATADSFGVNRMSVPARDILATQTGAKEASAAARRFLTHNLTRRLRMIGHFNVSLEAQGQVHKTFWIVRCGQTTVMVDSVTAGVHTLGDMAA